MSKDTKLFLKKAAKIDLILTVPLFLYWLIRYFVNGPLPTGSMQQAIDWTIKISIANEGYGSFLLASTPNITLSRAWDILIPTIWIIVICLLLMLVGRQLEKNSDEITFWSILLIGIAVGFGLGGIFGIFQGIVVGIGNSIVIASWIEMIIFAIGIICLLYQWVKKE